MKLQELMLAIAIVLPSTATRPASPSQPIAVPDYGKSRDLAGSHERPDPTLRYRVVFTISKAPTKPDELNPSLEKVARFLNLLAHDGVHPAKGDIVAVAFGPATAALMRGDKASASAVARANPNVALIQQLQTAGVTVAVCSQAMQAMGYKGDDVLPDVRIDDAAITTMANLQLRGFALIPD